MTKAKCFKRKEKLKKNERKNEIKKRNKSKKKQNLKHKSNKQRTNNNRKGQKITDTTIRNKRAEPIKTILSLTVLLFIRDSSYL